MAINAQPKVFNVVPGNSADTAEIQDAASSTDPSISAIFPPIYQTPLSAGGKAPERTTFNTLFKEYGEHLYYLQRGGVYGYDATLDYGKGATVYYNGAIYTAVAENGPSTDAGAVAPDNAAVWQKLILSGDLALALPAGVIIPFAGNVVPEGFLVCNGAAVSRTTYASLFAAIGTLYGTGDGSTTFNLPDARDRVLQGASSTYAVGTSIAAGLPNIQGYNGSNGAGSTAFIPSGAMSESVSSQRGYTYSVVADANGVFRDTHFNASLYNSIYSDSVATVQNPAVASYILIKV